MVSHHIAQFVVIGIVVVEIMVLICHVISQDYLTQKLCNFLARRASR